MLFLLFGVGARVTWGVTFLLGFSLLCKTGVLFFVLLFFLLSFPAWRWPLVIILIWYEERIGMSKKVVSRQVGCAQ